MFWFQYKKCIIIVVFFNTFITSIHAMNTPLYDENGTRYQLVQSHEGPYNWLFVPGGPGADSRYFLPLINALHLPGKTWLIDLPGNGNNNNNVSEYSFDTWLQILPDVIKRFENPIYVGHSFGGMAALLYPEFEYILKGLIIIGSSPVFDVQEIMNMRKARAIITDPEPGKQFQANPTDETFKGVLLNNAPCHFPPASLQAGRQFFEQLPFNFRAALWWNAKINEYAVKWVPQTVPTLIMGGSEDCVNPIALFKKESTFKRDNITITVLPGSGHFPWFENLELMKTIITNHTF